MSHFIFTQRTTISNLQSRAEVQQVPGRGEGAGRGHRGKPVVHYHLSNVRVSGGVVWFLPSCNYDTKHLQLRLFADNTEVIEMLMRVGHH